MSNKYMKKQLSADNTMCSKDVEPKEFFWTAGSDQLELQLWRATQQDLNWTAAGSVTQQLLSSVCKVEISCTGVPRETQKKKKKSSP